MTKSRFVQVLNLIGLEGGANFLDHECISKDCFSIVLVSKQGAVTYLQDQDFVAKLVL